METPIRYLQALKTATEVLLLGTLALFFLALSWGVRHESQELDSYTRTLDSATRSIQSDIHNVSVDTSAAMLQLETAADQISQASEAQRMYLASENAALKDTVEKAGASFDSLNALLTSTNLRLNEDGGVLSAADTSLRSLNETIETLKLQASNPAIGDSLRHLNETLAHSDAISAHGEKVAANTETASDEALVWLRSALKPVTGVKAVAKSVANWMARFLGALL